MALKAILTSEEYEALSENSAIQAEYVEKDGKYFLDVTPVDTFALEDVGGLKSAYAKQMAEAKELKKKVLSFEGIDPDEARTALGKVKEMSDWTPEQKVQEKIESVTLQMEEKHRKEMLDKDATIELQNQVIEQEKVHNAAAKAIADHGGDVDLLLPHVLASCKCKREGDNWVVSVLDAEGNPKISNQAGSTAPMTIVERVAEMKASDKFAVCFKATGAKGSGASGNNSANTGATKTGIKTIKRSDQEAIEANIEGIAKGQILVVDE